MIYHKIPTIKTTKEKEYSLEEFRWNIDIQHNHCCKQYHVTTGGNSFRFTMLIESWIKYKKLSYMFPVIGDLWNLQYYNLLQIFRIPTAFACISNLMSNSVRIIFPLERNVFDTMRTIEKLCRRSVLSPGN